MLEILGKKYISTKEAAHRYGLSMSWFKRRRWLKKEPSYCKPVEGGRVLYDLDKTDDWIKKNLMSE